MDLGGFVLDVRIQRVECHFDKPVLALGSHRNRFAEAAPLENPNLPARRAKSFARQRLAVSPTSLPQEKKSTRPCAGAAPWVPAMAGSAWVTSE